MPNQFNYAMPRKGENNATLSYVASNGKTYYAQVRVSRCAYTYGVVSAEDHARRNRTFYPHRRALGGFTITVDCIHYHQFRHFMNWLRGYTETLLENAMGNSTHTVIMEVQIPTRHFHKSGILITGISDMDHTASMVFSPQLTFCTVKDFHDNIAVKRIRGVSTFELPQHMKGVNSPTDIYAFYPSTAADYTDSHLYDDPTPPTLPPATGPGTGGGGGTNKRE